MIYVTSDLHGCSVKTLEALLEKANFREEDFLFVLGDVIDRGENGAELLLWLTQQPNAQLLLGNHENMMLACQILFQEVTEESLEELDLQTINILRNWLYNGGGPTLKGVRKLLKEDDTLVQGILEYLQEAPLVTCVEAGGKPFVLVHAGFGNFSIDRELGDYSVQELLWTRPEPDTRYFPGATVVFGHTPTVFYGVEHRGRAFQGPGWINIDTGAAMGDNPMLLRLDDLREFYL